MVIHADTADKVQAITNAGRPSRSRRTRLHLTLIAQKIREGVNGNT